MVKDQNSFPKYLINPLNEIFYCGLFTSVQGEAFYTTFDKKQKFSIPKTVIISQYLSRYEMRIPTKAELVLYGKSV